MAKPKPTQADKAYLEWQNSQKPVGNDVTTLTLTDTNAVIVIEDLDKVEVYMKLGQNISGAHLLAMGLRWSLENDEWRKKIARAARKKFIALCKEEGVPVGDTDTPSDTHTDT